MRCACDACDAELGEHDPRTLDGYCTFCGASCFQATTIGGRSVRSGKSLAARQNLHAAARVARAAAADPRDASNVASIARQEAADAMVRIFAPVVEDAGKKLTELGRGALEAIRRRVGPKRQ